MQLFKTNQNNPERVLRFLLSSILIPTPFVVGESVYTYILFSVGAVLLFNAVIGTCYIYRIIGVNTCKT